jgi:hypothetical protein
MSALFEATRPGFFSRSSLCFLLSEVADRSAREHSTVEPIRQVDTNSEVAINQSDWLNIAVMLR